MSHWSVWGLLGLAQQPWARAPSVLFSRQVVLTLRNRCMTPTSISLRGRFWLVAISPFIVLSFAPLPADSKRCSNFPSPAAPPPTSTSSSSPAVIAPPSPPSPDLPWPARATPLRPSLAAAVPLRPALALSPPPIRELPPRYDLASDHSRAPASAFSRTPSPAFRQTPPDPGHPGKSVPGDRPGPLSISIGV